MKLTTFMEQTTSQLVILGIILLSNALRSFFSIDVPPYESKDKLKNKLLYAIRHTTAIDLDTAPVTED